MKKWTHLLKHSLKLPKKKAVFALNRSEMFDAIVFLLALTFMATTAYSIPFFQAKPSEFQDMPWLLAVVYFYIIYYSLSLIALILGVSSIAFIARIGSALLNRRLAYRLLWKICAYFFTVPILGFIVLAVLYPVAISWWLYGSVIYILFLTFRVIVVYPRRDA
ncbi:DUF1189 family protein [Alteribacillus iranensis]|uniref:Yip1 domain-containing protein n=1 Tax=Alteribacillus iranensis TaxID=930128 RepID=A0A1I2EUS0_9BACI|nr:DUF1189 family protein [Alteribacillus iranensis]SFE96874.1 Protein of unknown function [Alteribacillus iranensis]